jgi:hypothetical protein
MGPLALSPTLCRLREVPRGRRFFKDLIPHLYCKKKKSALSLFSKSSKPVKHLVEAKADMGTKQPAMYPWISRPVNPPKNLPAPGPHMAASPVWWDEIWTDLESLLKLYLVTSPTRWEDPICIYIYNICVCVFSHHNSYPAARK